jgi:hypothetical protein
MSKSFSASHMSDLPDERVLWPDDAPAYLYENKSNSICFLIAGFCTLTATIRPSPSTPGFNLARWTCAIDAEASGCSENSAKTSSGLIPKSDLNTCHQTSASTHRKITHPNDFIVRYGGRVIEDMAKRLTIGLWQKCSL